MRTRSFYTLISAALWAAAALPAHANAPFSRPSAVVAAGPTGPAPTEPWLAPEERELANQKRRDEVAKRVSQEEMRKKYNLKEGQEAVEIPFKGARVGTVNGMNVYRGEGGGYYFEAVEQRKYIKVATPETYEAPPPASVLASAPDGASTAAKQEKSTAGTGSKTSGVTVGKPASAPSASTSKAKDAQKKSTSTSQSTVRK